MSQRQPPPDPGFPSHVRGEWPVSLVGLAAVLAALALVATFVGLL